MCCALPIGLATAACTTEAAPELKVISFNIRLSDCGDADGGNHWNYRKEASLAMVDRERPDVMGLQEGCPDQIAYLDEHLTDYGRIGVGRDDGDRQGEMMAIYYRKDRIALLDWGTCWLSETPDSVSFGWDAACRRTMTWGMFERKDTGDRFLYINTHLDHKGPEARAQSIRLIVRKLAELDPEGYPAFLTADFNSSVDEAIFDPLKAVMQDARATAPQTDNLPTFNDWGRSKQEEPIDHIFYKGASAVRFETLTGDYGAPYISDHYPIAATFRW